MSDAVLNALLDLLIVAGVVVGVFILAWAGIVWEQFRRRG